MSTGETEKASVIRETDADAVRLALTLIHTARHGALAVHGGETGHPGVSRVQLSTDSDGSPVTLVSFLSPHAQAMVDHPKAALLVGEPGKGDPLAHARISLFVEAEKIDRASPDHARLRARHIARHPKAELYADFGDFAFFRLKITGASLNGGFGKAYNLTADDLAMTGDTAGMAAMEASAVAHMNADHSEANTLYATRLAGARDGRWSLATLDPQGMTLVDGDQVARVWFDEPLDDAGQLRKVLKVLADRAREKGAQS